MRKVLEWTAVDTLWRLGFDQRQVRPDEIPPWTGGEMFIVASVCERKPNARRGETGVQVDDFWCEINECTAHSQICIIRQLFWQLSIGYWLEAIDIVDCIWDEHTIILWLDWFWKVVRTIGPGWVYKVAGLYEEWGSSVPACVGGGRGGGRGGEEEGVEEEAGD